jgi:hypothetical protein
MQFSEGIQAAQDKLMNVTKRAPECSDKAGLESHANNTDFGFQGEKTPTQSMTNFKKPNFSPVCCSLVLNKAAVRCCVSCAES